MNPTGIWLMKALGLPECALRALGIRRSLGSIQHWVQARGILSSDLIMLSAHMTVSVQVFQFFSGRETVFDVLPRPLLLVIFAERQLSR